MPHPKLRSVGHQWPLRVGDSIFSKENFLIGCLISVVSFKQINIKQYYTVSTGCIYAKYVMCIYVIIVIKKKRS